MQSLKITFIPVFLFVVIFSSCKKDSDVNDENADSSASPPVACFMVDDTLTVDSMKFFTFTNCSQNAVRFEWDFGDGDFSLIANPTHRFSARGNHRVRLTAYNSDGVFNTISKIITIGYYSLTKIEYRQLYASLTMPVITRFYRVSLFSLTDTLQIGDLPFSRVLTDSAIYDFTSSSIAYTLQTTDSTGFNANRTSSATFSAIINNKLDLNFTLGPIPADTSKVTLHYKILYREP